MTRTELLNASIRIPGLFASGVGADCHTVSSSASGFTYKAGIPSTYSSLSGKKVCRGDMNGIGRVVSQGKWFNQLGGYYTYNQEVSDAIGGYPQGAVLKYKDAQTGKIREVMSLIPDNNYNFVESPEYINDVYWTYVDNVPSTTFRPRIFPLYGEALQGILTIGNSLVINKPCMFMVQTGASIESTTDGDDYYLFLKIQRNPDNEFHNGGLIAYLPANTGVVSQGVISAPMYDEAASIFANSFHCFNSPSPIQLYLLAGDTIKLQGNRDFSPMNTEAYQYWIFPLTA